MDLLNAIRKNDITKVEKLLKKGYYIRINDPVPDTQEQIPIKTIPLCLATARGQLFIVKLLLQYGADVRACNTDWAPPIHLATYRGYIDILKYFLTETSKGAANIVNSTDQTGDTPLHIAARYSKVEIVNLFLENGCDFSIVNKANKTPLDTAKEVFGKKSDAIFSAISKKMKDAIDARTFTPARSQLSQLQLSFIDCLSLTFQQQPLLYDNIATVTQPPQQQQQTANLEYRNDNNRQNIPKRLINKLVVKENKIVNLKDDITTSNAEKNKIKVDIAKLTKQMNQQDIIISKKETEINTLVRECDLIRKWLQSSDLKTSIPNIEEKSLECPVCLEVPLPPKNVYQCTNGHIYCSICKDMPIMNNCPVCRVPLDKQNPIRNLVFTDIIVNLFPNLKP